MRFAEKVFFSIQSFVEMFWESKNCFNAFDDKPSSLAVSFFCWTYNYYMASIFHVATALQKVASSFYDYFTIFVKVNPYYSRRRTTNININNDDDEKNNFYLLILSPSFLKYEKYMDITPPTTVLLVYVYMKLK